MHFTRTKLVLFRNIISYKLMLKRSSQFIKPLCAGCFKSLFVPSGTYATLPQKHAIISSNNVMDEMSTWQKIKWNVGLHGKLEVPRTKLLLSGMNLYVSCTDFVDFSEFVKGVNLPDTFTSWFLLVQLHTWLVNVKLSQMGKEGVLLKKYMYTAMWQNVERRLETFQDISGSERRKALENYYSLMVLSVLYYDEGLLGSDKTLANSLWIQLYGLDPAVQTDKLEILVEYVRKQVHHHDQLDPYPIMRYGYISFLPLFGDKLDEKKVQRDIHSIEWAYKDVL
ncbi:unnamed protein product [Lymnaea stagnalis]|uniref:Ubiquinol-cytochrome c chaperone domain-containing protein n=1 Tax=Lymnaea stagnalis TaxID=6523 RepID=A0AAV2HTT3_LYMST